MDLRSFQNRRQTRKPNISGASDSSSSSSRSESNLPISYNRRNYKFSSFNSGNMSPASNSENVEIESEGKEEEEDGTSPFLIGTCPNMCPAGERSQRERLRDLAVFERLHGNPGKTSPSLAVKKFCRTISSKHVQASNVRPLPVLEDTLSYLLNLTDSTGHPFEVLHDFIFDRTRSIRQDLVMQSIVNDKAINMYEKMVRFHVESHHKLKRGGSNESISSVHYLNMEQLIKALTSLYNLYDSNRDPDSIHENEAQFRSLYVLLHLDSRSQPMGESLSLWFRRVPHSIMQSKEMQFARSVLRFFRMDNYKRFFCTVASEASYIQYCIIERYINEVRVQSLACINNVGYKLHPYPLAHLSNSLIMKESDLEVLCNACGLETFEDEMGNKFLPTKQTTFSLPKGGFQKFNFPGLERFET